MKASKPVKPRARDLGIPFDGTPGALNALTDLAGTTSITLADEARIELESLAKDPALLASVKRESFYATGLELIEAEACPCRSRRRRTCHAGEGASRSGGNVRRRTEVRGWSIGRAAL